MSSEMAITQSAATQAVMTGAEAINILKVGNERFVSESFINRSFPAQINATSTGQYPFAAILSCIDSRVPAEIVFDQGIGDIFSARVAGNVTGVNVLGSLEYAVKYAGSKLIVVLGHTSCGAVKGACDDLKDGNLTGLLAEIRPAVEATKTAESEERNSGNSDFVNNVVLKNVHMTIDKMFKDSEIIREMTEANEIEVVGAVYDVKTGKVEFV
ncbi:MAG: carbonic anhydrase [Saprospiraceae bacterium]|jgi:carbonic anhydrase